MFINKKKGISSSLIPFFLFVNYRLWCDCSRTIRAVCSVSAAMSSRNHQTGSRSACCCGDTRRWFEAIISQVTRRYWCRRWITEECLRCGICILHIRLRVGVITSGPICRELRDGDGRQNTDDRDNNHELDEGKTLLAFSLTKYFHVFSFLLKFIC